MCKVREEAYRRAIAAAQQNIQNGELPVDAPVFAWNDSPSGKKKKKSKKSLQQAPGWIFTI